MRIILTVAVLALAACGGGGGGGGGEVSAQQFQQLQAQVQTLTTVVPKVSTLQANVAAVEGDVQVLVDTTIVHTDQLAQLAAQPLGLRVQDGNGAVLGAYLGLASLDGLAHSALAVSVRGELGYLYSVPVGSTTSVTDIGGYEQNGNVHAVYFESVDCTGQAYMLSAKLSPFGAANGYVFSLQNTVYYYVPAGSAKSDFITANSSMLAPGSCVAGPTTFQGYTVFPNDPGVTGVPNAQVVLPVSLT